MERLRLPVGVAVPPVRQAFDSWPLRSRRSPENAVGGEEYDTPLIPDAYHAKSAEYFNQCKYSLT